MCVRITDPGMTLKHRDLTVWGRVTTRWHFSQFKTRLVSSHLCKTQSMLLSYYLTWPMIACNDQTSNSLISVLQCHPWIGNAGTHSTWRIYNRVAITHLLQWMSQKRTYYNKYGLRPSNTITAEGLEDKVSPSTPMTSLSKIPRPKAPYSSSEKSATWYVAARKWASTWNMLAR